VRSKANLGLRALFCGAVLAVGVVSPALAADPNAADAQTSTFVSGVSDNGTDYSGVTPAMVKAKEAQLQTYLNHGTMAPRYVKTGAAAKAASAMSASLVASPMYAASSVLSWYPGFYQKTTYWCVPAVVQSIAYFDLEGEWYYDLGSGSISGAQSKIYNGYTDPDGTVEPAIKVGGSVLGSDDTKAIAWVNRQFKQYASTWFYLAVKPTSQTDLMNKVHYDVASEYEPTYIRVDLATASGTGYMWYQAPGSGGTHPEHATLAVGYNDSASTMQTYDPFSHPSGSSCSHAYNVANNWGCNWTITQARYYKGMDRILGTPVWY
jgi:hypothetical protein